MKVVFQSTNWKLVHTINLEYEIYKKDGSSWILFTALLADNDAVAIQKAVEILSFEHKKLF
ncbi:hypothetical protein [Desulfobulbus alkaliphilus]|uniref:hypothetical protein n=1 Tax=Desulfobulbus alkaliphilus TaxID=869814 RepID=UPI00196518F9|nr:hypothetical protein [Desulfobulbus alkaliphilus]MBM9538473.1 hypothetical protein [Desulfobulbus alkaliphilus]